MFGTLSQPPHPQISRNSGVSPAAVSERAAPAAAGVRGGRVRGVGARQFRGCSPSGGGIASTREQRWWGGAPGGSDSGRGTEDPRRWEEGRRRATPPSARRRGGLWEGREVGEEAWVQKSSAVTGRAARRSVAEPTTRPGQRSLGVAPVTLHPERAGSSRGGAAGGRSCPAGPRAGGDPTGGGARARRSGAGVAEAAGDLAQRPRDVIRIRRSNPLRAGADPGGDHRARNAGGPRFPDMVEKSAPGTGQLDVAWGTVGDWAGRSQAWRGWRWRNSKLLSPPQPH